LVPAKVQTAKSALSNRTPAGTTRGFGEDEFRLVGELIARVLDGLVANGADANADIETAVRSEVEMLCKRATTRQAFGKPLAKLGANYDIIAEARIEIEMARLLCLKAAYMMDTVGTQAAQPYISQIKVVAPRMALKVIDESMQMHGGRGISQDFPLWQMWHGQRTLRFADGPDAVHRMVIARTELKKYRSNSV